MQFSRRPLRFFRKRNDGRFRLPSLGTRGYLFEQSAFGLLQGSGRRSVRPSAFWYPPLLFTHKSHHGIAYLHLWQAPCIAQFAQPHPQDVLPFFLSRTSCKAASVTHSKTTSKTTIVPAFAASHPNMLHLSYFTRTFFVSLVASL